MPRIKHKDKNADIKTLFLAGVSMREIACKYMVSVERIRQILKTEFMLSAKDGGFRLVRSIKIKEKKLVSEFKKNERYVNRYRDVFLCSLDEFLSINKVHFKRTSNKDSPAYKYYEQRNNAITRGISWEISFVDWWAIWELSGKWEQRGAGKGFCMGRIGDIGAYEKDNVYICTIGQNFSDSYIKTSWEDRKNKRLAQNEIIAIRNLINEGKGCSEIAKLFNVGRGAIARIKNKKQA